MSPFSFKLFLLFAILVLLFGTLGSTFVFPSFFGTETQKTRPTPVNDQPTVLISPPASPIDEIPSPLPTASPIVTPTNQPTPQPPTPQPTQAVQTWEWLAQDTFGREAQQFWGTASDGKFWSADANTKEAFFIEGEEGHIDGEGIYHAVLGAASSRAVDVSLVGSLKKLRGSFGIVLRWTDKQNWYRAYLWQQQLIIARNLAGQIVRLNSIPFEFHQEIYYTLRFQINEGTLRAKAWETGTPEPAHWIIQARDAELQVGKCGIRAVLMDDEVTIPSFAARVIYGSEG